MVPHGSREVQQLIGLQKNPGFFLDLNEKKAYKGCQELIKIFF